MTVNGCGVPNSRLVVSSFAPPTAGARPDRRYEGSNLQAIGGDVIGNPHSCIFDSTWTTTIGNRLAKVLGWYDNEYGYSSRTADLIARIAKL